MPIHILLPGVSRSPLVFKNLPLATTVGQLKSKVTSSLQGDVELSYQRLIYLGRSLMNDDEPLQNIFGLERVRCLLLFLHYAL